MVNLIVRGVLRALISSQLSYIFQVKIVFIIDDDIFGSKKH